MFGVVDKGCNKEDDHHVEIGCGGGNGVFSSSASTSSSHPRAI